jgi:hypothetical protein
MHKVKKVHLERMCLNNIKGSKVDETSYKMMNEKVLEKQTLNCTFYILRAD